MLSLSLWLEVRLGSPSPPLVLPSSYFVPLSSSDNLVVDGSGFGFYYIAHSSSVFLGPVFVRGILGNIYSLGLIVGL